MTEWEKLACVLLAIAGAGLLAVGSEVFWQMRERR